MIKNITVTMPRQGGKREEKTAKVSHPQKRSKGNTLLNLFNFIGEIAVPRQRSS